MLHPVGRTWLRREEDPSDKISDMTIPFRIPSRYRMKESYAGKPEIPFSASVTPDCHSMEQWIRCYQIAEHAKILHSCLPASLTLAQKTPQIFSITLSLTRFEGAACALGTVTKRASGSACFGSPKPTTHNYVLNRAAVLAFCFREKSVSTSGQAQLSAANVRQGVLTCRI